MIEGSTASRILLEVMRGIVKSDADTPEEAEYRQQIKKSVDAIHHQGAVVDLPHEWP